MQENTPKRKTYRRRSTFMADANSMIPQRREDGNSLIKECLPEWMYHFRKHDAMILAVVHIVWLERKPEQIFV